MATKPPKPYPEFPLFAHAAGVWAKKIRGKLHYFGPWGDPDAALQKYLDGKDALHAGRTPRDRAGELTVRDLLNRFLTAKRELVETGEIQARTFGEYHATCEMAGRAFGMACPVDDLAVEDFAQLRAVMAKRWGPVRLGNEIQRVRTLFKFAYDSGLTQKLPRYGQAFQKPSRRVLRVHRGNKGSQMLEAAEIRQLIAEATQPLRAMIHLAANCGFGNTDVASLPLEAVNLDAGWVDFARPKTGIPRRCPLWGETTSAIKESLATRPEPQNGTDNGLLFITPTGKSYASGISHRAVSVMAGKVFRKCGIHRPGVGFYTLRRVFETIGGGSKDQVAVDSVMGHAPPTNDMAAVYRQRIDDDRLLAVTDHVHQWLFRDKEPT